MGGEMIEDSFVYEFLWKTDLTWQAGRQLAQVR